MNSKHPTPKVHPAYQALYGKPSKENKQQEVLELFRKLSDYNQGRALAFAEALVSGDQQTVKRIQKDLEIETAYLQQQEAGGES